MDKLTDEELIRIAREQKNKYQREWCDKNRAKVRAYQRQWAKDNPDKVKQHQITYWIKQAEKELNQL